MTPYQRGAAFEHRVKREWELAGWLVWRTPGSKTACDLIAIRDRSGPVVSLIQCKLHGDISRKEWADLEYMASAVGARAILASMVKGSTSGLIHYRDMLARRDMIL